MIRVIFGGPFGNAFGSDQQLVFQAQPRWLQQHRAAPLLRSLGSTRSKLLLWENYDGEQVLISQSFWRGHVLEPKTRQSRAPVPIIAQLARRLDLHRFASGSPTNGLVFRSPAGKPINLDGLAADVIVPLVTKAGVRWHGWHAFRRGLATILHQLGVSDKTIQRILRHANVAITQGCYIKTADSEISQAMQQFERSLEYAPNMHPSGPQKSRLM
jgi:integrase